MDLKHFLSLRNDRVILFIILGIMGAEFIAQQYFPDRTLEVGAVGFGGFFLLIGYMELQPLIVGRTHLHGDANIWVPGKPPRDWHFDIYFKAATTDDGAAKRIADVFSLIESDPRKLRFLRLLGGRFWYPYLRESIYPLDIPGYGSITKFCLLLPHPFTKFFQFTEREYGAYLTGTQYTHPASVHFEAVLAPFHIDFLGEQLPMLIVVMSSYTVDKVTQTWAASEDELARHFIHMGKIIEENGIRIFPEKEIDDMGIDVLEPEQRIVAKRALKRFAE